MTKEASIDKPLVEQIIDETLEAVKNDKLFDENLLGKLWDLASRGRWKEPDDVLRALNIPSGE